MGFFHLEEKGHKPGSKKLDFFRHVINSNVIMLFAILKHSTASEIVFGFISFKTLYFTQIF